MVRVLQNRLPVGYLVSVDLPKDLRVSFPAPLDSLARQGLDQEQGLDGRWVEVSGGELPGPIAARIDRTPDGRFVVTGLVLGMRGRQEVTWETVRAIKPATILSYIFSDFDPKAPASAVEKNRASLRVVDSEADAAARPTSWAEWAELPAAEPSSRRLMGGEQIANQARVHAAYELWRGSEEQAREVTPVRRPRATAAVDLAEVVEVWRRHYALTPRKATQATATELHISRATVLRRLKDAEDQGLLSPGSTQSRRANKRPTGISRTESEE